MLPLRKIFNIALLIPLCYYLLWSVFEFFSWPWASVLNMPAHAFLAGSLPWSIPVVANVFELQAWLLQLLRIIFVSLGFAINITMLVFMIRKISKDKKLKKQNKI